MGVAGGVEIGAAEGLESEVAGGVEMGVVGGAPIGVAGGVAIALVGGVAIGVAGGVAIGEAGGVAGVATAGRKNNSKLLTRMGIDGAADSAACGCAELWEIPQADVRTKKTKLRMAQVNFPCRAGAKNIKGSPG
jgi:hypothetical protein